MDMQGLALGLERVVQVRWRAWLVALVTLTFAAFATSPALAQEKDELARRHFESGAAYFAEAEYEDALKAFKKAYELSNRPEILLNISIVEERLGHLQGAVDALDEYMQKNPSDPELETIRLRRDNLAERLGKQQSQETIEAPPPPAEPRHGEAVVVPEEEAPAPPPEPRDEAAGPNQVPAYVAFGAGALAGIGALATGLAAQSEYDDLESSCGGSCTDDDTSSGETLALTSTILTGVAVVGVSLGFILWDSDDSEEDGAASGQARVGLELTPGGATARALLRF